MPSSLVIKGIVSLVFLLMVSSYFFSTGVVYVTSNIDGRKYLVQDRPDKQEAANMLARIVNKLEKCVSYLNNNISKYPHKKDAIKRLNKFNPNVISEKTSTSLYTSYTVNKGESMIFCLRTRDNQEKLHDENLLTFVAIHELSHIATKGTGHINEFDDNFKFILKVATDIGLYQYENYNVNPKMYCGILVNNPII